MQQALRAALITHPICPAFAALSSSSIKTGNYLGGRIDWHPPAASGVQHLATGGMRHLFRISATRETCIGRGEYGAHL